MTTTMSRLYSLYSLYSIKKKIYIYTCIYVFAFYAPTLNGYRFLILETENRHGAGIKFADLIDRSKVFSITIVQAFAETRADRESNIFARETFVENTFLVLSGTKAFDRLHSVEYFPVNGLHASSRSN